MEAWLQLELLPSFCVSAVDMFLKQNSHYMSPDAVLLHITPLEISGVKVNHENQPQNQNQDPYTPYK